MLFCEQICQKYIYAAKQNKFHTFTTAKPDARHKINSSASSALNSLKTLGQYSLKPALFIVWIQRWTCPLSWQLWTSLHEEPCWGGIPRFPLSTTTCWPSRTVKVKVSEPVVANRTSCPEKQLQLTSHQTHKTSLKKITTLICCRIIILLLECMKIWYIICSLL